MSSARFAHFLLRLAVAFPFLYAGIDSLRRPEHWNGFFPDFVANLPFAENLFLAFSIFEILLAVWLLVAKKIEWAAYLATLLLLGIVITNPESFLVTFRDIGLALAALSLGLMARRKTF